MRLLVDLAVVFLVLCAATAIVVAAIHHFLTPVMERRPAKWRAQVRFAALVAPVSVGFIGVAAAMAPSLLHVIGLSEDHCLQPLAHNHAHLCFIHGPAGGSVLLSSLVIMVAAVIVVRAALVVHHWWRASKIFTSVLATSSVRVVQKGEYLFDSEVPVCVTTGLLRPAIYISSAAAAALGDECTDAALAHERAHLRRQETRVRFLMSLMATFHVPVFGRTLLRRWQEDSEFLCDYFAARSAGSPTVVADALIRFQRALLGMPVAPICASACLCSSGEVLHARVNALLATDLDNASPADDGVTVAYVIGLGLLAVGLALQAGHLHHALESFVGILKSWFVL